MNKIEACNMHKAVLGNDTVFCVNNVNYKFADGKAEITNENPSYLYETFRVVSYVPSETISEETNKKYINYMIRRYGNSYLQAYLKHIGLDTDIVEGIKYDNPKSPYLMYMKRYRVLKKKYPKHKMIWTNLSPIVLYIMGDESPYTVKDYNRYYELMHELYLTCADVLEMESLGLVVYNITKISEAIRNHVKENNLPKNLNRSYKGCIWFTTDAMHGLYDPEKMLIMMNTLTNFIKEHKKYPDLP